MNPQDLDESRLVKARVEMSPDKPEADGLIGQDGKLAAGEAGGYFRKTRFEPLLEALLSDPLLSDVPRRPTLADVETLIGVELGSGMRLTILKMDGTSFDVAMLNQATVRDLKTAVQKKVTELEQTNMGHRQISWRHVWGNYCLMYDNNKLVDEGSRLKDYGIKNNDQLQFAPHLTQREAGRHSHARKRRFFHGLRKN